MTNSPPANVKLLPDEAARVLASGFDTVQLSLDVRWLHDAFFEYLAERKLEATDDRPATGIHEVKELIEPWRFTVRAFGLRGYEWILDGHDVTAEIAAQDKPGSRPNVRLLFRSEGLWRCGPEPMLDWMVRHLLLAGAEIHTIKASRLDPCVDILLPESVWSDQIREQLVTRAALVTPHFDNGVFSGLSIGKGMISARFYDKPLEIRHRSNKVWMYDVWGLDSVPDECRIIRVEFQLRREKLKALGLDRIEHVEDLAGNLWAYCSQNWLKVQDRPGLHHTQRHTVPWWCVVQDGFTGAQGATPLVLAHAQQADRDRLGHQLIGLLSSLTGLRPDHPSLREHGMVCVAEELMRIPQLAVDLGISDEQFTEAVVRKQAKYQRSEVDAGAGAVDQDGLCSEPPF